jgi:hypothetical protein
LAADIVGLGEKVVIANGLRRRLPQRRQAKNSENRDFSTEDTAIPAKIRREIRGLDAKFVTWRINGIFPPINEFLTV